MQPHEWVGVKPMATRRVATIDHRDPGIGVPDQRVNEGHPHRARSDDQVVDGNRSRHLTMTPTPWQAVKASSAVPPPRPDRQGTAQAPPCTARRTGAYVGEATDTLPSMMDAQARRCVHTLE